MIANPLDVWIDGAEQPIWFLLEALASSRSPVPQVRASLHWRRSGADIKSRPEI